MYDASHMGHARSASGNPNVEGSPRLLIADVSNYCA